MNIFFYIIIILFIVGYACIALEHPLKTNKTATALILGVALWTLIALGGEGTILNPDLYEYFLRYKDGENSFLSWIVGSELTMHLGSISETLFFLICDMIIVEIMDTYGAFKIITDKIKTTSRVRFLWIIGLLTFVMASILDNMTSTIVMVTLLRKIVADKSERWFFASLIVLAANAGGAWSPIGDVTTIMLWVGEKVNTGTVISTTFLASLVSFLVPLIILTFTMKGHFSHPQAPISSSEESKLPLSLGERKLVLFMGTFILLFVIVFKSVTHLPPAIGLLGGLGVMWGITEILRRRHAGCDEECRLSVLSIMKKIDLSTVLFFLGILLAVAALEVCGHLLLAAEYLEKIPLAEPEKHFLVNYIIGILSSIVDNVPLVAGAMGIYDFATGHYFWNFLAYCAGTGGSILIIGSAAGVAAMGLEKIDFFWYLKKISWLAFIGYTAGALTFIAQNYSSIKEKQMVAQQQEKNMVYIPELPPVGQCGSAQNSRFIFTKFGSQDFYVSLIDRENIGIERGF